MSAAIEVPRVFVDQARVHLSRTGQPLLTRDRRRVRDWEFVAMPDSQGYLIMVGPTTHVAQTLVAMKRRYPQRDLAVDLCSITAAALEGLPRRFTCEGLTVGLWEASDARVCVRGAVALSCLSWMLRNQKVGCYLTLWEADSE